MLRTSDIVERADFRLASLEVSPSRRQLSGPAGEESLEPRVLQVLLCLSDSVGQVVTRDELHEACWGGAPVGEDSMNRAVAKLRRALEAVSPGTVEIETIPRTGYRLHGEAIAPLEPTGGIDRRWLLGGGAALAAVLAGGTWLRLQEPSGAAGDPEVARWIDDADKAMREWISGSGEKAEALLTRAIEREPDNARAWGLLALVRRRKVEREGFEHVQDNLAAGKAAVDRALRIDPHESNALTAHATLQPEFGNWGAVEGELRDVLRIDPSNFHAKVALVLLLQEVGRSTESWDLNEELLRVDPLSPTAQYRRALKHWIFGRLDQAGLTINRSLQTWPQYTLLWFGRFYIYMFGGRASDALRILQEDDRLPDGLLLESRIFLSTVAKAIATSDQSDLRSARNAIFEYAPQSNAYAGIGVMALSQLGLLDDAFELARGYMLRRGPLAGTLWVKENDPDLGDHHWVRTMNLFTPPTRAFRLDPRFADLADEIGMERYWRESGTRPDAFLMR